jgi:flagellar export protein FliJ
VAKRFVFNLEAVLDRRTALEETERRKVAELERERLALEDRIRAFQRAIGAARQDLRAELDSAGARGAPARPVSLHAVRMQAGASLHLVTRAQQSVLQLAGVHRRLDTARLDLLKAAADRKAVELLKSKRFEEWKIACARAEARENDEIGVLQYSRNEGTL